MEDDYASGHEGCNHDMVIKTLNTPMGRIAFMVEVDDGDAPRVKTTTSPAMAVDMFRVSVGELQENGITDRIVKLILMTFPHRPGSSELEREERVVRIDGGDRNPCALVVLDIWTDDSNVESVEEYLKSNGGENS